MLPQRRKGGVGRKQRQGLPLQASTLRTSRREPGGHDEACCGCWSSPPSPEQSKVNKSKLEGLGEWKGLFAGHRTEGSWAIMPSPSPGNKPAQDSPMGVSTAAVGAGLSTWASTQHPVLTVTIKVISADQAARWGIPAFSRPGAPRRFGEPNLGQLT